MTMMVVIAMVLALALFGWCLMRISAREAPLPFPKTNDEVWEMSSWNTAVDRWSEK